jgi:hypothetical protein
MVLTAIAGTAAAAGAADQPSDANAQLQGLQKQIRRAHERGDMSAYLSSARLLHSFLNGSPRSVLQLMSAQLAAGAEGDALNSFEQLARMGQSNDDALAAKQFDTIRGTARYGIIHAAMAANNRSVSTARKVFELQDSSLKRIAISQPNPSSSGQPPPSAIPPTEWWSGTASITSRIPAGMRWTSKGTSNREKR